MKIIFEKWTDKHTHMLAGTIMTVVFGVLILGVVNLFFDYISRPFAGFIGLVLSIIVGYLKEVFWDGYLKKGTRSREDFISTTWGALVGFIAYLMLVYSVF